MYILLICLGIILISIAVSILFGQFVEAGRREDEYFERLKIGRPIISTAPDFHAECRDMSLGEVAIFPNGQLAVLVRCFYGGDGIWFFGDGRSVRLSRFQHPTRR